MVYSTTLSAMEVSIFIVNARQNKPGKTSRTRRNVSRVSNLSCESKHLPPGIHHTGFNIIKDIKSFELNGCFAGSKKGNVICTVDPKISSEGISRTGEVDG